ncbi:hypothetical protein, partial [Pseudonocardia sp. KRD291]|uniref:hypothetical protein n=1 Tax=Pseudonocardia sp. KRD291 TaxID=2792007 RepID=UPI001C4A5FFC
MLEAAAALRWRRPRLTAELARQVVDDAVAAGDGSLWLRAAGWYLHGRAATEDARGAAVETLTAWDAFPGGARIGDADAARLRVELAVIAQSNGDLEQARSLVAGPAGADARPARQEPGVESSELELDRLAVLVRCALAGDGGELPDLKRSVDVLGSRLRAEPAALADLLVGSIHRSSGDGRAAVESALDGLANLGWTPDVPDAVPTSPHLAAALFSQWITALLDDASSAEVSTAVRAVRDQHEQVDTGRQGVLLRLILARALPDTAARTAAALRDVADRAADAGAPSLEAACRATQAEVHEGIGEYREALAALRAGTVAERVDRSSAQRFRDALTSVCGLHAGTVPPARPADVALPGAGLLDVSPVDDIGAARIDEGSGKPRRRGRHGTVAGAVGALDAADAARPWTAGQEERGPVEHGSGEHGPVEHGPGERRSGEHRPDEHRPDERRTEGHAPAKRGPDECGAGDVVDAVPGPSPSPEGTDEIRGHLLEWAERSWYGPGRLGRPDATADSGAPLADAMVEELRQAASRPAAPTSDPGSDGSGSRPVADEPLGPVADEPLGPVAGARGDGDGSTGEQATPMRREPWAALMPGAWLVHPETDAAPHVNGHDGPGPERLDGRVVTGDDEPTPGADVASDPATASSARNGHHASTGCGAESSGGAVVDVGDYLVVLDLWQGDRPVRHPSAAAVVRDVAERAGRLVPPRGEIRLRESPAGGDGLVDDRGDAMGEGTAEGTGDGTGDEADPGRVEVVLPDADRVTAMLWAQSLVGYVAGRVGRGGLPAETTLRSRVHDTTGPVGDGVLRGLTGPEGPRDELDAPSRRHAGERPEADAGVPVTDRDASVAAPAADGAQSDRTEPGTEDGPSQPLAGGPGR